VTDESLGKLIDEPAWQSALGSPELLNALVRWARSQPFDVELFQVHNEGESGSFVATVALRRPHAMTTGAILKILPADLAEREVRGARLAADAGPASFVNAHLTQTLDGTGTLPGDSGRWVHMQRVAQAGPAEMVPLAAFVGTSQLADYSATILNALGREWNDDGPDPEHPFVAPAAYLQRDLMKHMAGLRQFASAVGWDPDRPPEMIDIPGRAERLPNPFRLVTAEGGKPVMTKVFLGRGHGDLHLNNVMLPLAGRTADPTRFRLIDIGRFRVDMEISRDPAKLLLAVAQSWLVNLNADAPVRSRLAELVVHPEDVSGSAEIDGFVLVARRLHGAAAAWAEHRDLVSMWRVQHRLVLGAAALRTASRVDVAMSDRWWYLDVAALALRKFVPPSSVRSAESSPAPPSDPEVPAEESDLRQLLGKLREALRARDGRQLIVLVGSGMTAQLVPPIADLIPDARWFSDSAGPAPRIEVNEPVDANPRVQQVRIPDYVEALWLIKGTRGMDGVRAFLQKTAMKALAPGRPDEVVDQPLPDEEYRRLERTVNAWQPSEALAALALLIQTHRSRIHPVLLTTNFDPLLEVALLRAGLQVTSHAVSGPAHTMPDLLADPLRPTVVHLHGTPHSTSLHFPAHIQSPHDDVERWLASLIRGNRLLVLGYSGWDRLIQRTLTRYFSRGSDTKADESAQVLWCVYESRAHHAHVNPDLARFFDRHRVSGVSAWYGINGEELMRGLSEEFIRRPQGQFYATARQLRDEFGFGLSHINSLTDPALVFWQHRLREPHLLHGVHALTAAVLSKQGVPVELHLDDTDVNPHYAEVTSRRFAEAVHGWFDRCGVDRMPTVHRISELQARLGEPELSVRMWGLAKRYFKRGTTAIDALVATKVATFGRQAVAIGSSDANRVLRPLHTWLALEDALQRHGLRGDHEPAAVTLGGIDEQGMWDLWRRRPDVPSVASLFVPRLHSPVEGVSLWDLSELSIDTAYAFRDMQRLLEDVASVGPVRGTLLEWVFHAANRLAAFASDGLIAPMRDATGGALTWADFANQLTRSPGETCAGLAEIVAAWLYHDGPELR
jgi:hypothetical protein